MSPEVHLREGHVCDVPLARTCLARLCILSVLIAFAMGIAAARPAQAQTVSDQSVRAAFVFNLTKYVEWPETTSSEFLIGVIGDGAIGPFLKVMFDGKTTSNRPIRVVLSPTHHDVERCSIVYVSYSSKAKIQAALDRVPKTGVLTVGEVDHFTRDGGIVSLASAGGRIQVQIDENSAVNAHLKISSRLMNIAVVVNRPRNGAKD